MPHKVTAQGCMRMESCHTKWQRRGACAWSHATQSGSAGGACAWSMPHKVTAQGCMRMFRGMPLSRPLPPAPWKSGRGA
eukprot:350072-Chlamydomonas_euryale.AAC.1